jgi:Flp pilus assembly protein RcpC/CpaB
MVATTVPLGEASGAALVHVGDSVDVLASGSRDGTGYQVGAAAGSSAIAHGPGPLARIVAAGAQVLARVAAPGGSSLLSAASSSSDVIVVAVSPETARALAWASTAEHLSFVVHPVPST